MQSQSKIVKFGEDINIPTGAVVSQVVAIGGSITVAGTVKEDVVAVGGSIVLTDTAKVGGDTVSVGGKIVKAPGATIQGDRVEVSVPAAAMGKGAKIFTWGGLIFSILSFLAFLALAFLCVALFQKQLGMASHYIERRFWSSVLWGFLGILLIPTITLVLIISIIGIFFIPLFLLLVAAAMVFGYVTAAQLVGKKVIKLARQGGKPMMIEVFIGLLLLFIIGFLPILGWLVQLIASLCGLGSVMVTRFGTVRG